jgi:hypothetical protein
MPKRFMIRPCEAGFACNVGEEFLTHKNHENRPALIRYKIEGSESQYFYCIDCWIEFTTELLLTDSMYNTQQDTSNDI